MKTKLILAALFLAATAAPAFAAGNNVCLYRNQIDGWGARDDHSMIVNDRFGRKYLVTLSGICSDLNYSFGAGFKPLGAGGPCLERGDHVIMRGGGAMDRGVCWVNKILPYSPEMQKADKEARANKQPLTAY
jgi:hypothetical protein